MSGYATWYYSSVKTAGQVVAMLNDTERINRLLSLIDDAFHGVVLGNGVSLHQTLVRDNHGSEEEEQAARVLDEKHDWHKLIENPEFTQIGGTSAVCFFDEQGLRFHLPAFLALSVSVPNHDVTSSLLFAVTRKCLDLRLLNETQRKCVYEVLLYLCEVSDEYLIDLRVRQAMQSYWNPMATEEQQHDFATLDHPCIVIHRETHCSIEKIDN